MVFLTGYFFENKTQKIKTQKFLSGYFSLNIVKNYVFISFRLLPYRKFCRIHRFVKYLLDIKTHCSSKTKALSRKAEEKRAS